MNFNDAIKALKKLKISKKDKYAWIAVSVSLLVIFSGYLVRTVD